MKQIKHCEVCGTSYGVELHHIIYRSECKPLEKCKYNFAYLCGKHHKGDYGPHGKYGEKFNRQLKLGFQNWLENIFTEEYYTLEEIQKELDISSNAIKKLSKLMHPVQGIKYKKEDVIRVCMGGKKVI
ncbi:hypothetical protein FCV24_12835 [Clostridium botulinum]|uniref:hypothetical protein n=1 Tax=Clostridium botulinum TaxID=1491 RepID=UPI0005F90684|nr:hypothetical protein [Clostridium botulinum]MBY6800144.1 hypothetical protein [Clostridium botulinum]NFF20634.1 hypothetical protein [Clostridium botulinum]NFM74759.1 hypothetical protein [Clostridium botulinum]NFP79380.1 hypothetical protein [Clostridium botulinum]NFP93561.1 hypothetical protein [Clostridium botulinum]